MCRALPSVELRGHDLEVGDEARGMPPDGCASSRERRIDDGCTVTITTGARSDSSGCPRSWVTFTWRPTSACAGTAPRQTSTRGLTDRELGVEPLDGTR